MIDIYNKLISNTCIYTYSLLLFLNIIDISNLTSPLIHFIFNVVIVITFFINIIFLIFRHSFRESTVPLLFLFAYLIFFLFFKIKLVPIYLLLVYIMYKNSDILNMEWFVKCNLLITFITFVGIVLLNLSGRIPSISNGLPGVDKGYTLGFTHPDGTGVVVVSIISSMLIYVDYWITQHKKYRKIVLISSVILSLVLTLVFYPLTQCKELLFFEIIIIALMLFYRYRNNPYIYKFIMLMCILFPAMTVYFNYRYNPLNKFYYNINTLFSGRLSMQQTVLNNYPIHFFQYVYNSPDLQTLRVERGLTILIDNSYVSILEYFGIIGIIISAIFLLHILYCSMRSKAYIISVIIFAIILCSSVQSTIFSIFLDGPLLYSGILCNKKLRLNRFS